MEPTSIMRIGVEIELLAPPGRSRLDLARAISLNHNGAVERFLHPDAEPSKLEGTALFHHLTHGYRVTASGGDEVVSLVDDITIRYDLNPSMRPSPGWWRLVSDDRRLIDLAERTVDAEVDLPQALKPLADAFGTTMEPGPDGMWRILSPRGEPVAIGLPMPGERERVAEVISRPITGDHTSTLDRLLGPACELGFTLPHEGATHVHFDAWRLRSARSLRRFVQIVNDRLPDLRRTVRTNGACTRLGPWPVELATMVAVPGWDDLTWPAARARLQTVELTKYCDINLKNLVDEPATKDTIEVRCLPASLDASEVVRMAEIFHRLINEAAQPEVRS